MFRYEGIEKYEVNKELETIFISFKNEYIKFKYEWCYGDDEIVYEDLDEEIVLLKVMEAIVDNLEVYDLNRYTFTVESNSFNEDYYVGSYSLGDIVGIKLKSKYMIMDFSDNQIKRKLLSVLDEMDDYLEEYYDEIELDYNPLVDVGLSGKDVADSLFNAINNAFNNNEDDKLIFDYSKGYIDYEDKDNTILFPVGLTRQDVFKYRKGYVDYEDIEIVNITNNGERSIVTFDYGNYIGIKLKTLKVYTNSDKTLKDILIGQLFIKNLD